MAFKPIDEEALFHAARRIGDSEARSVFIKQACAENADLIERVIALLDMHEQDPDALDETYATTEAYQPRIERVGARVGPYRLKEQIGEGGFGLVFVAEQQEPVKRKVALKIIKPGMDSEQIIARFEAERQALALMEHPNIARVLDAGSTDSGRPYFVMELVRGIPITEYCDQHQLATRERLELFVTVCHAIQHAHQKGIIHRDIKPSNVLVTSHDGKPVAKVIDFGVAKAIHGNLTDKTIYTNFAQLVGTPLYMSPEQAEMSGLDVDTRSDIYSLGVLLYELLTGSTPLEKTLFARAAYDEIRRLIREEEPPNPSTRLSTMEMLPSVAACRKTEPAKLSKLMRGDLDWITMKALEKDRTRRYETANSFALDIQRHLNDEVVEARPPSATYRFRKFVRKNRAAFFVSFALILMLIVGVAGTTWGLIRARQAAALAADAARVAKEQEQRAREMAEGEAKARAKAETALRTAEQKEAEAAEVLDFVRSNILAAGRPKGEDGGLGHDVSLRDAIRASLPDVGSKFIDQPLVEAKLRDSLGGTFYFLGDYVLAATQLERAHRLYERQLGSEHDDTLQSMSNLAASYGKLNRHGDALKIFEQIVDVRKRKLGADHPSTLQSMNNLAVSYASVGRNENALTIREEALAATKRLHGPDHSDTLTCMNNLASSYHALGRVEEALKLLEEVLATRRRLLSVNHPETLDSMSNLAISYTSQKRHPEAFKLREDALAGRMLVLGVDHPDTIASKRDVAESLVALGRFDEALPIIDELFAIANRPGLARWLSSNLVALRLRHFQEKGDAAGCRTTAEKLEKLNPKDINGLYNAACCRAITASLLSKSKNPTEREQAGQEAEKAMHWLKQAVAAGFRGADDLKRDSDLDSLRTREDFKKLIVELEEPSKNKSKK